jgi:hypothetical protein
MHPYSVNNAVVLWLLVLMAISGCKAEFVSPVEYNKYVGNVDNGLIQKVNAEDFEYEVHYLPPEEMAIREIGLNAAKDSIQFAQTLHDFDGFFYFQVIMKTRKGVNIKEMFKALTGSDDKQKSMEHLAFGLQSGFYCKLDRDSLPSEFYHYQPTGGVDNRWQFAVSVANPSAPKENHFNNDLIFNFQDSILAKDKVSVVFSKKDLNNIPKIIFQL